MPTYQYTCTECGEQVEVVQKFTDDPLTVCTNCGGRLRKVFSPVGIVFKGSGFYRTDSRKGCVQRRSRQEGQGDGRVAVVGLVLRVVQGLRVVRVRLGLVLVLVLVVVFVRLGLGLVGLRLVLVLGRLGGPARAPAPGLRAKRAARARRRPLRPQPLATLCA